VASPPRPPRTTATGWIDVNVHLSQWPARRVPDDDRPAALVDRLREGGLTEAWAGSFDGLLHKDLAAVNARLAEACRLPGGPRRGGFLRPFGSVNPAAPDWEEDLHRCAREHRMPGIRLHPNYHGYALDLPDFGALLRRAADLGMLVQLVVVMEDERMMHPLLRVPPVDLAPLADVVRATPKLRLVLLNALRTSPPLQLRRLFDAGDVSVEIATQEGVGGLGNLLAQIPVDRVLFGSHAPLFYPEAATLKLRESVLAPAQLAAIRFGNARRLLPPA
jgi:predicted TIM-barrel fold metal-dependent hydrolase